MTVVTGVGATFKQGGGPTVVSHTAEWTIDVKVNENPHATNSTSGWKQRTVGTKDWTGTVKVYVDDGGASPMALGTSYAMEFHIDNGGSNYYSGTGVDYGVGDVSRLTSRKEPTSRTPML